MYQLTNQLIIYLNCFALYNDECNVYLIAVYNLYIHM